MEQAGAVVTEVYTVTVEESDFYEEQGGTTSSSAGIGAYVKIVPKFTAVSIDNVFYNGEPCTVSETDANRYEFTMPAKNVKITVEYSFTDNSEDNFLGWKSDNPTTFAVYYDSTGNDWYPQARDGQLVAEVIQSPMGSGGYFNVYSAQAFSLNEDVIPDDALSVEKEGSSPIRSFTLHIDCQKISVGTAQLVLLVDNGHKFGDAALLVVTITVTSVSVGV